MRLTDSEWQVLTVLWDRGGAPLGQVVDDLKSRTGWARNTVHTYLSRMEAKGLVSIGKERTPHVYRAAVTRSDCAARERRGLLERAYQGSAASLVAAFLKEEPISAQERDELRRLLDEMEV